MVYTMDFEKLSLIWWCVWRAAEYNPTNNGALYTIRAWNNCVHFFTNNRSVILVKRAYQCLFSNLESPVANIPPRYGGGRYRCRWEGRNINQTRGTQSVITRQIPQWILFKDSHMFPHKIQMQSSWATRRIWI